MSLDLRGVANDAVTKVFVTCIAAVFTASLGWIFGPLKWLWLNRNLRRLLSNGRTFRLTINPLTGAWKNVSFLKDGMVGEGQNQNEHTWKIRRGKLEIIADNGVIFSRFYHDRVTGQLKHTNEPDLPGVHGQFLVPFLGPKCKGLH